MQRMMFDGKVAVVTGAGRSLGKAYAMELARRGAKVVVNDRGVSRDGLDPDPRVAAETADAIIRAGGQAVPDTGDIGNVTDAESLISKAIDHFGRIDILVSNAAVHPYIAFEQCTADDVLRCLQVDVIGSFNVARAAWPHMLAQKYGRMVFSSSSATLGASSTLVAYAAAKGGVYSLGRSLAVTANEQAGCDIKSNVIAPFAYSRMNAESPILTPGQIEARRTLLPPERVAQFVMALVHETSNVNGHFFAVGGGRVTRLSVFESEGLYDPDLTAEKAQAWLPELLRKGVGRELASTDDHLDGFFARIPGWNEFQDLPLPGLTEYRQGL